MTAENAAVVVAARRGVTLVLPFPVGGSGKSLSEKEIVDFRLRFSEGETTYLHSLHEAGLDHQRRAILPFPLLDPV